MNNLSNLPPGVSDHMIEDAQDYSGPIVAAVKSGRCSSGEERGHGRIVHAVTKVGKFDLGHQAALCGTRPGKRSVGWSEKIETLITCHKCLGKSDFPELSE